MSAALPQHDPGLSHEEYFALEQREDWRYEYLAGEVFAMAGGSESHALIGMNVGAQLAFAMRDKPCRVYGSDMKVRIDAVDKFCYPDVQVVCEKSRREQRFVTGPTLIVEVLSDSTESYDRGLKFEHFRLIPELRYYLLIDQTRAHAELFQKSDDGRWWLSEFDGTEASISLDNWDLALEMAEIYRDVEFTTRPEAEAVTPE
jgi:Uma2 family endonuclease